MITHDQILPSLYHLQRWAPIGPIQDLRLELGPVAGVGRRETFARAFPGQTFEPLPRAGRAARADVSRIVPRGDCRPAAAEPGGGGRARPIPRSGDPRRPWGTDQHVLTVKPLVLQYAAGGGDREACPGEGPAGGRGIPQAVRPPRRWTPGGQYRAGRFGEFRCGEAKLIEPYYYRHSNFQNWFTRENSDPFTYIGCHYVDLVYFITGLRPVEVSVRGVEGAFPNGNVGYLWSAGQVRVGKRGRAERRSTGWAIPTKAPGTNDQGLCMFCEGTDCGGLIRHDDQFRGVSHGYVDHRSAPHSAL